MTRQFFKLDVRSVGLKSLFFAVTALATLGVSTSPADAALLGLTQGYPDITTGFVDVTYTQLSASLGHFSAMGINGSYALNGVDPMHTISGSPNSWSIDLDLDPLTGALLPGGTLVVRGAISDLGITPSTLLLTGSIANFGFGNVGDTNNNIFEFLFTVTGGALASDYGGIGSAGGVILNTFDETSFLGSFANESHDFSFVTFDGAADTFHVASVPEPSSLGMLLIVGAAMVVRLRRASCRSRD